MRRQMRSTDARDLCSSCPAGNIRYGDSRLQTNNTIIRKKKKKKKIKDKIIRIKSKKPYLIRAKKNIII